MIAERANCTVLLIDDEQAGLQLRDKVLQSVGFKTLSAVSSEEGLKLFRMFDVDVIVTDHLLGRSTADVLAIEMKRHKPHIPIVSLSGTTSVDEALRYADYFVGKGEGPDALIEILDKILEQNEGESQSASVATEPPSSRLPLQALLAAIVEDSTDAILSKTLDGIITSWNHAAETMYGYSREEMIGKSVTKLLPADRPDEVTHILSRLKRGERISHFETVRVAKDGRTHDVALTISPIRDAQGNFVGASTIARDITEQKGAEEALRRAEKLALAGRMTATIAHEINNPLESVGNILFLLRNSKDLSPELRAYVEAAQEELKRVSEITKLTLGMQRSASNQRESVEPTKLLENVLTLYYRKAKSLGITIERKYRFEGAITGSAGELRQVFSNLVVNAMDALVNNGDKLVLGVRLARNWSTGQCGVRISILDNGTGIDPDYRSRIFQPFYTTKGDKGTGIGLWVSQNIVTQHRGTLRVRSSVRPGRSGTCFSVFLPLE